MTAAYIIQKLLDYTFFPLSLLCLLFLNTQLHVTTTFGNSLMEASWKAKAHVFRSSNYVNYRNYSRFGRLGTWAIQWRGLWGGTRSRRRPTWWRRLLQQTEKVWLKNYNFSPFDFQLFHLDEADGRTVLGYLWPSSITTHPPCHPIPRPVMRSCPSEKANSSR